jgi:hypothetical protein
MECRLVYTCECNNKEYPSSASLKAHRKTKGHLSWENAKEVRDLKMRLTERDNEILALNLKIERLKELNTTLILRLKDD